jgi:hypothetical protein
MYHPTTLHHSDLACVCPRLGSQNTAGSSRRPTEVCLPSTFASHLQQHHAILPTFLRSQSELQTDLERQLSERHHPYSRPRVVCRAEEEETRSWWWDKKDEDWKRVDQ